MRGAVGHGLGHERPLPPGHRPAACRDVEALSHPCSGGRVHDPAVAVHEGERIAAERFAEELAEPVVAGAALPRGHRLDLPGRGRDEREAVGVGGAQAAGQVDHADRLTCVGVVQRRGRAGPGVHLLGEVLGGEDLHRMVHGEGGSHGVGAHRLLAPLGAERQVDRVRPVEHPRVAVDPEDRAVGIAEEGDLLVLGLHLLPKLAEDRRRQREQARARAVRASRRRTA